MIERSRVDPSISLQRCLERHDMRQMCSFRHNMYNEEKADNWITVDLPTNGG
jgi:hypothetical protein